MIKALPAMLAVAAAVALAGCGKSDKADSDRTADVEINVGDKQGESRDVSIKVPGFETRFDLPEAALSGGSFDIDGVGMYPGSSLNSFNVNAADKSTNTVTIGFTAPDAPAKVAAWYAAQFAAKSVAVTRTGDSIAGKSEDGDDFRIELSPADDGGSAGKIMVVDADAGT